MNVRGMTIKPMPTHKFLGVIIDEHLSWCQHIVYTIGKGTVYVLQMRCLAIASKGLPLPLMRQLFTSITLPKLLYAIDVWFTPLYSTDNNDIHQGSIVTAKKLNKVQQIALLTMTGAVRTTATDMLEAHTNLQPLEL